ncbi:hypothetical protein ACQCT6_02180 [Cytobacillus gottheilii]|uniref:DUF2802 domain-containing protein n=1 Tax=Cytobacillus gottheilii TaxID=859144 RepID=A0ABX8F9W2_9BACI|nr:hypothetical protein [Cytobacillus gottheilii]QVY60347.1 hypothetical protein J1899_15150 [Cytobacillus gottheilii]
MIYVLIALLVFSLLLFVVSIFLKDPYKTLREDIDQLTMQQVQDMYVVKKKLKVLEEELLLDEQVMPQILNTVKAQSPAPKPEKKEIHDIIKNQVLVLSKQGLSIDQIARQSSLTEEEVENILRTMKLKGDFYA